MLSTSSRQLFRCPQRRFLKWFWRRDESWVDAISQNYKTIYFQKSLFFTFSCHLTVLNFNSSLSFCRLNFENQFKTSKEKFSLFFLKISFIFVFVDGKIGFAKKNFFFEWASLLDHHSQSKNCSQTENEKNKNLKK